MTANRGIFGAAVAFAIFGLVGSHAAAQKSGGILRQYIIDSPASMSIHEETTVVAERPMMGVMNNLVMFDQHVAQNSLAAIVPELATDWAWDEDGTRLTFQLRQGVKWHDGKPFTAADVKCTWDLVQGKTAEKLRVNPRKAWYDNLAEVLDQRRLRGDFRAEAAAAGVYRACSPSGMSPVYPVPRLAGADAPASDRHRPVQIRRVQAQRIHQGGEEPGLLEAGAALSRRRSSTRSSRNRSTAILAFVAGKYELTFAGTLTIPLTRDLQKQRPDAICELPPGSVSTNLIINREKPPFDNPELRRAMALALDRQAFIDILTEGKGFRAAAMQPPPGGQWGMPRDMLEKLPGYGPDVAANRAAAREIMKKLGYGPDKPLQIKVSTRDVPPYRDPAVILIDQLKEIYIDAELEPVDTAQWYPEGAAQGLYGRAQPDRHAGRRSRCDALRKLRMRRRRQLQRLLQSRDRPADRPAIDGAGPGQAPAARVGDRTAAGRGRRQAADLFQPRRHLLGPEGEGPDRHGQQHLQRLAHGGRLARSLVERPNRYGTRSNGEQRRFHRGTVPKSAV